MTTSNATLSKPKSRSNSPKPWLVEISYLSPVRTQKTKIASSLDAYELLVSLYDDTKIDLKEMFSVLLLNRAQYCLGFSFVGIGAVSGVAVNKPEIFQLAILSNSSSIILCHNHPSGNLTPSEMDLKFTQELKGACTLLNITLLDHLIISSQDYKSMADEGLI